MTFNTKEYQKLYRQKNKEKIKEYRESIKDSMKEYMKEYYDNNKDKFKIAFDKYYKNNKDKVRQSLLDAQKRFYLRERDYILEDSKVNEYKHQVDRFCQRARRNPISLDGWLYTMRYATL